MDYVLDASAMPAYLRGERGADVVDSLLEAPRSACYAHSVNMCEVYRRFVSSANRRVAEAAVASLSHDGVGIRQDLDQPFWQDIGDMIALVRATPNVDLSLADAFGFALARRLSCEFVTADHKLDSAARLGLCTMKFIR